MTKTALLFVHFHADFPHSQDSSWVIPTRYENKLGELQNTICLSTYSPSVRSLFSNFEPLSDDRIGYLSQTIATEYWILNHLKNVDYVGVAGYRRLPYFGHDTANSAHEFNAFQTVENWNILTNDSHLALINMILGTYDAIAVRKAHCGGSIRKQFIGDQRQDLWNHFIDSIATVVPEYKRWLGWFDLENQIHFYGPMGLTPLLMFKDYADMYIRIITEVLRRVENPFLCLDDQARYKTDRWIGYLAERFYPFFLFVNNVKTYHVPTVFLSDPPSSRD